MDINQIIQLITNNGIGIVLMAYFLIKDWKFNGHIINVLTEVKEFLAALKTHTDGSK